MYIYIYLYLNIYSETRRCDALVKTEAGDVEFTQTSMLLGMPKNAMDTLYLVWP